MSKPRHGFIYYDDKPVPVTLRYKKYKVWTGEDGTQYPTYLHFYKSEIEALTEELQNQERNLAYEKKLLTKTIAIKKRDINKRQRIITGTKNRLLYLSIGG